MSWELGEAELEACQYIKDCVTQHFDLPDLLTSQLDKTKSDVHILSDVNEIIEREHRTEATEHLKEWRSYQTQLSDVQERLSKAVVSVNQLVEQYFQVAHNTSSLHDACEQLMSDQTKLASSAEELRNRLTYYHEVDRIFHKLNSPMLKVTSEAFVQILNSIDESLAFIMDNPEHKESAIYVTKYQQCLSRAMSAVRTFFRQQLASASETVRAKALKNHETKEQQGNEDLFTLYYGVFAAHAAPVKLLMENIEIRWERNVEYQQAIVDCQRFYFEQREQLVLPNTNVTIQQLSQKYQRNVCSLVRNACSFLLRLCEDEQTLFYRFFSRSSPILVDFVERLCIPLYDTTRPLLMHISHLEALAELCAILQAEMSEERLANHGEAADGYERLLLQLLADIRERLVYRAHIYARSDIAGYTPAPGDVAYPEKLEMMELIAQSQQNVPPLSAAPIQSGHERKSSVASTASLEVASLTSSAMPASISPADMHGFWYPPVRRSIMCLSKLYKSLDTTVFQGLSLDILAMCIQSLLIASNDITKRKGPLDGELFLLKHLLILREQTTPFRIGQPIKETALDFGKIKDAAWNLFGQRGRIFSLSNNSLLQFLLQAPHQVTEQVVESGRILDSELRRVCQDFINRTARDFLYAELRAFLIQAEVITEEHTKDPNVMLSKQPFAKTDIVRDIAAQAYRKLKDNWPILVRRLNLYVANADTENVLLSHIKKNVKAMFANFLDVVNKHYTDDERQVIAAPMLEQVNLLLGSSERS